MEIEIVTFVVKGSTKLTVPTYWQEQIQVVSRSVALRRVFDLQLRGIDLTVIILKVWVMNVQSVVDVSICEVELRCFRPRAKTVWIPLRTSIEIYWTPKEMLQSSLLLYFIKCDTMAFLHPVKVVRDVFEDKCQIWTLCS